MKYLIPFLCLIPIIVNGQFINPKPEWKIKTNGKIIGSASYSDGTIYLGSNSGTLYALNAQNGTVKWKFNATGKWISRPLIQGNMLYQLNGNGVFYAINKDDGAVKWTFKTGGEHPMKRMSGNKSYDDLWDYYLSGASYDNNTIYFGSSDGNIYALDSNQGILKWKFKTEGEIHATPVIKDSVVFAGSMDGNIYALKSTNGSLLWKFNTIGARYFPKGAIQRSPIFHQGTLLFGSRDFNLYAIDIKTGHGLWNYKDPGGWIIATPSVYNGHVYVGTSDSHRFYSFSAKNGTLNWETSLNMRVYGSAVFDHSRVYFGCFNGFLYGLNVQDGTIEWKFQTDGSIRNYHTVYDKGGNFKKGFKLYGSTLTETKNSEAKIQSLGSILATPLKHNGILYFGSTDSMFYAVMLPD